MAVAAAKKQREKAEPYLLALGVGTAVLVGLFVVKKFVKEAGEAKAARDRPKQPWDV